MYNGIQQILSNRLARLSSLQIRKYDRLKLKLHLGLLMEEQLLSTGTVQVHIRLPADASCFLSECQHHIILRHQSFFLGYEHTGIVNVL